MDLNEYLVIVTYEEPQFSEPYDIRKLNCFKVQAINESEAGEKVQKYLEDTYGYYWVQNLMLEIFTEENIQRL